MKQRIAANRFIRLLTDLVHRYLSHGVAQDSAALTYYLIFALFPLITLVVSLLSSNIVAAFAPSSDTLLQEILALLPDDIQNILAQYINYLAITPSRTLIGFSTVFAIYAPMRAAGALLLSVRKAYNLNPPTRFFIHQFKTLLYTVCLVVVFPVSLILQAVGERALRFVTELLSLRWDFIELWNSLRFLILAVLFFLAIAFIYALAQEERRKIRDIWPGVTVALLGWMLLSVAFSFYVENAANYSLLYGSLGTIIILLLWLYLTASVLIMGAEFNGALLAMRDKKHTA